MTVSNKLVGKMLHDAASNIETGKCGLSDDEMVELASMIAHRKMNIEQICQHYGITRMTLNRWQQKGKLPSFRKDSGGHDYMYLDEMDLVVRKWEAEHPN